MNFKKIKKQFWRFLINIGTSGKYTGEREFGMSDYLIKYILMNCIIVLGSVILAAFIVLNLALQRYFTAAFCCGMIVISIVSFVLARTKIWQIVPASMLMIFYALFCIMLTWIGEDAGGNFLFIYMYPSLTIMLLGMRFGITLSAILGATISLEMFVPGLAHFEYHFDFSIRMLVNYFLVFFVMVVVEITRKTKDRFIEIQNQRLQELKEEAEAANRTKSNFLASMSHEIRTPMNAITGMAELLLRGEISGEARGYAQDIKQAGNNLISIINDILDFSKIEAGKLEIIPVKYLLSSLVNDTVNIIRMRLTEKPIRFYTNIDGNIPNSLTGDEVRLRQIILNLLSNAVKYSERGHIGFSITIERKEAQKIWLKITVADTGKGIRLEDQEKLFGDFVQVDTKKNRGIEGTGLGLAITRRLCRNMGGDITVESEYGKGSVFTAIIPQDIDSGVPFAAVNEPEKKKILVYEGRAVYAKSVCWSLENMGVPYTMVANLDDFAAALNREEWFYVFSGYGLYEKIRQVIENTAFPNGKKPPLALMVEFGNESYIPNVRFISLPVQSLSIANTLNGNADSRSYFDNTAIGGAIRFTFPKARLLVVDDIATNLKVAEGLLAPYETTVDTCLSGLQAIEMVKQHEYDIVFMDHMMPEMDGIEATAAIRTWEKEQQGKDRSFTAGETQRYLPKQIPNLRKQVPIIALTANAVSGMREMFIEKGFNDFLAKPIDISKLDETLARWIPKYKRAMSNEPSTIKDEQLTAGIPGVDMKKGLAMTGGTTALYRQVLTFFRKDAGDRLPLLQTVPKADAIGAFTTLVHALKSASASLGADDISAKAAALEAAGKAGSLALIENQLPVFAKQLAELIEGIRVWEDRCPEKPAAADGSVSIMPLLRELASALGDQRAEDIDRILEQLTQQSMDDAVKTAVEQISDEVLVVEYDKAGEILKGLFSKITEEE